LLDFQRFLDFLYEHPNVVSAETKKFVRMPDATSFDKTLSQIERAFPAVVKDKSRAVVDPVGGVCAMVDKPESPAVLTSVRSDVPAVLTSPKQTEVVAKDKSSVVTNTGSSKVVGAPSVKLLGKKLCCNRLETVCSKTLAAHIVSHDKISRVPDEFDKQLAFLVRKRERLGCDKLGLNRVRMEGAGSLIPDRCAAERDFEAEWRASETSSG